MTEQNKDATEAMEADHPGAVCSHCGRTVTEAEYDYGASCCCEADVCDEGDYDAEPDY